MEVVILIVMLAAKIVADVAFGRRALDEVGKLRVAIEGRLDNHDVRIASLEDRRPLSGTVFGR